MSNSIKAQTEVQDTPSSAQPSDSNTGTAVTATPLQTTAPRRGRPVGPIKRRVTTVDETTLMPQDEAPSAPIGQAMQPSVGDQQSAPVVPMIPRAYIPPAPQISLPPANGSRLRPSFGPLFGPTPDPLGPYNKNDPCIDMINDAALERDTELTVVAQRLKPTVLEPREMQCCMSVQEIRQTLAAEQGGGIYKFSLYRNGAPLRGPNTSVEVSVGGYAHNIMPPQTLEAARAAAEATLPQNEEVRNAKVQTILTKEKKQQREAELELQQMEIRAKRQALEEQQMLQQPQRTQQDQIVEELRAQNRELLALARQPQQPAQQTSVVEIIAAVAPIVAPLIAGFQESARRAEDRQNRLFEMMLQSQQGQQPKNSLQELSAAFELFERMRGGDKEESPQIDPKNGWNNIWVVAKQLMDGISAAAPSILVALQNRFPNTPPQQLSQSDILMYAEELRRQQSDAPQPQQIPLLPAVQPATSATVAAAPATPPEQVVQPGVSISVSDVKPVRFADPSDVEQEMKELIGASIGDILIDVDEGRAAQNKWLWVDKAIEYWHDSFLREMHALTPGIARINMLRSKASPLDFEKVDKAFEHLLQNGCKAIYSHFMDSVNLLCNMWETNDKLKKVN